MVGRKMLIKVGKTKDIVQIDKVHYGRQQGDFLIECTSLCRNTSISLVMTANEVKNCLME